VNVICGEQWDDWEWRFRHILANAILEKSVRSRAFRYRINLIVHFVYWNFYLRIIDRISNIAEIISGQITFARHEWKIVKRATKSMIMQASRTRDVYSYSESEIRIRDSTCAVGTRDRFSRYFNVGSVLCVVMSTAKRVQEEEELFRHILRAPHKPDAIAKYGCRHVLNTCTSVLNVNKLWCILFFLFKDLEKSSSEWVAFKIVIFILNWQF